MKGSPISVALRSIGALRRRKPNGRTAPAQRAGLLSPQHTAFDTVTRSAAARRGRPVDARWRFQRKDRARDRGDSETRDHVDEVMLVHQYDRAEHDEQPGEINGAQRRDRHLPRAQQDEGAEGDVQRRNENSAGCRSRAGQRISAYAVRRSWSEENRSDRAMRESRCRPSATGSSTAGSTAASLRESSAPVAARRA